MFVYSRLQEWNLLERNVKTSVHRNREKYLLPVLFSSTGNMSYHNDADGLTKSLGHHHKREKWRLFTDTAKVSLKGFPLYVRN